jgi:hypothetical protein
VSRARARVSRLGGGGNEETPCHFVSDRGLRLRSLWLLRGALRGSGLRGSGLRLGVGTGNGEHVARSVHLHFDGVGVPLTSASFDLAVTKTASVNEKPRVSRRVAVGATLHGVAVGVVEPRGERQALGEHGGGGRVLEGGANARGRDLGRVGDAVRGGTLGGRDLDATRLHQRENLRVGQVGNGVELRSHVVASYLVGVALLRPRER